MTMIGDDGSGKLASDCAKDSWLLCSRGAGGELTCLIRRGAGREMVDELLFELMRGISGGCSSSEGDDALWGNGNDDSEGLDPRRSSAVIDDLIEGGTALIVIRSGDASCRVCRARAGPSCCCAVSSFSNRSRCSNSVGVGVPLNVVPWLSRSLFLLRANNALLLSPSLSVDAVE